MRRFGARPFPTLVYNSFSEFRPESDRDMGKTSRALLICALALGVCRGGAAAEDCKLNQVASLPVHYVHNQIWVEIAVDDTPVNFIVDTGAQYSEISRALAARLHLPVKTVPGAANGVTGSSELNAATIPTLQMGRMTAHNEPFFVDANFGDGSDGGPTGLFGADFLSNYGIEIDLADQKFNLYARDYCPDHVVYWAPMNISRCRSTAAPAMCPTSISM